MTETNLNRVTVVVLTVVAVLAFAMTAASTTVAGMCFFFVAGAINLAMATVTATEMAFDVDADEEE